MATGILLALSFMLISCGAAFGAENEQRKESETNMASRKKLDADGDKKKKAGNRKVQPFGGREEPGWVYHLSQAQWHSRGLKESTIIKVANAIEERGWTQAQAAKFLGVSQPRISDLMRGQYSKFTLDTLVEMLYALDKPVKLVIEGPNNWNLSTATPTNIKELEDKIAYYTKLIRENPRDGDSYYRRAAAYEDLQKYDLAIGDYTRTIELEPDRPGPRNNRANCYRGAGQLKAAIDDCTELIRLFPEYNGYQNRGLMYQDLGEYDKALADQTKAIEMDPQRPGPHWNRARLNEKLGRFDEAIKDYENTLKADPSYKAATNALEELRKKHSG